MRPTCSFGNSALEVFACFFSSAVLVSCKLPPHLYLSQLLSLSSIRLPFTLRTGNIIMSPSIVPFPAGGWHSLSCWTQERLCHKLFQRHVTAGDAGYIMQKISKSQHGSSPLFPHHDGIPESNCRSLGPGARQGRLDGAKCTYRFKEKSCFLWILLTWSGHLWLSIIFFFPF